MMRTDELVRAWRTATDDLCVPPDFPDRVLRGGRRRSARRRVGVAAGVVLTITMALVGFTALGGNRYQVTDERLTQPTGGDLADDPALIENAVRAWQEGIKHSWNTVRGIFDDPRSAPHVYWAGTTPAGPAAVVLQSFYLHPHSDLSSNDWDELQTLVGLVGIDPATGRFLLLGDQYQADNLPAPGYFSFGPDDRTVLVVERERPVYIATSRAYSPEGRLMREWQRLTFTEGVAVVQVPAEVDMADVRVVEAATPPEPTDRVWDHRPLNLTSALEYLKIVDSIRAGHAPEIGLPAERRLPWHSATCRALGEPRPSIDAPARAFLENLWEWGAFDATSVSYGFWCVAVGLADGSTVIVSEAQEDERPSRLFALTTAADGTPTAVQVGDSIDPSAPLPVAIRLTGGHGWVVAAYGSELAYRTTVDGDWTVAGTDAALLSDAAVQVRVTRPGQAETVVMLTE